MRALSPAARHALLLSAILAVVWSVAAALRPSSTFHLAPILVTLGGAVLTASVERGRPGWVIIVATGGALSIATTGVLAAAGWLVGPSLLPFGGPAAEAIIFTVGTAVVGSAAGLTGRLTSA
jgi:hypothetical protein